MKRSKLLKHLKKNGCQLEREGARHSIWLNPQNGRSSPVPRHNEIPFRTAVSVCRLLGIAEPTGEK